MSEHFCKNCKRSNGNTCIHTGAVHNTGIECPSFGPKEKEVGMFKVGDRVRVVASFESIIGKIGTIDKITTCKYPYKVVVDGNSTVWNCTEQDLELVKPPTEAGHTARTFVGHLEGALDVKEDKKQYGHPKFYKMLEAMADLHSRKNHDYAGTSDPLKNLRACERLELDPFMGVMVRLQDKWSRLEEFVKSGKLMVKGESVKDTLMDNAVYSILAIILYEEQEKEEPPLIADQLAAEADEEDRAAPTTGGH